MTEAREACAKLQAETDKGKLELLTNGKISDEGVEWLFKAVDNSMAVILEQDRYITLLENTLKEYNPTLGREIFGE